jgi:hypothetical protein
VWKRPLAHAKPVITDLLLMLSARHFTAAINNYFKENKISLNKLLVLFVQYAGDH